MARVRGKKTAELRPASGVTPEAGDALAASGSNRKPGPKKKPARKKPKVESSPLPSAPVRDSRIAEQVKTLAGQGATKDNSAVVLGLSVADLDRLYASEWAQGLAIGEIKVQQTLFDQGVGRRAEIDQATGLVTRAEVKPNPNAAVHLHKQFARNRARQNVIDLSKVHPEQLPPGVDRPDPPKRGRGRPRFSGKFTRALGAYICREIAAGRTVTSICAEPGMPPVSTIRDWAADDETYPDFSASFAHAREAQIEAWGEQALRLADNIPVEAVVVTRAGPDGEVVEVRRERAVAATKVAIDTRLKLMARVDAARRRAGGGGPGGGWNGGDDDDGEVGVVEVIIKGGSPK